VIHGQESPPAPPTLGEAGLKRHQARDHVHEVVSDVVVELAAAGYITRQRNGRRNQYTINAHLPFMTQSRASRTSGSCSRYSPPPESDRHDHRTDTASVGV